MNLEPGYISPLEMLVDLITAGPPCLLLDLRHKATCLSVYLDVAKARGTCWIVYRGPRPTDRVIRGVCMMELLSDHHEFNQDD